MKMKRKYSIIFFSIFLQTVMGQVLYFRCNKSFWMYNTVLWILRSIFSLAYNINPTQFYIIIRKISFIPKHPSFDFHYIFHCFCPTVYSLNGDFLSVRPNVILAEYNNTLKTRLYIIWREWGGSFGWPFCLFLLCFINTE